MYQQMKRLSEAKKEVEARMGLVKRKEIGRDLPAGLEDYEAFMEALREKGVEVLSSKAKQKIVS